MIFFFFPQTCTRARVYSSASDATCCTGREIRGARSTRTLLGFYRVRCKLRGETSKQSSRLALRLSLFTVPQTTRTLAYRRPSCPCKTHGDRKPEILRSPNHLAEWQVPESTLFASAKCRVSRQRGLNNAIDRADSSSQSFAQFAASTRFYTVVRFTIASVVDVVSR